MERMSGPLNKRVVATCLKTSWEVAKVTEEETLIAPLQTGLQDSSLRNGSRVEGEFKWWHHREVRVELQQEDPAGMTVQ